MPNDDNKQSSPTYEITVLIKRSDVEGAKFKVRLENLPAAVAEEKGHPFEPMVKTFKDSIGLK
jgi:hypothetical protein